MDEFQLKKGYLITKDLLVQQKFDNAELLFIPAWLFLLMNSQNLF